jgi:hypothetical protein
MQYTVLLLTLTSAQSMSTRFSIIMAPTCAAASTPKQQTWKQIQGTSVQEKACAALCSSGAARLWQLRGTSVQEKQTADQRSSA